MKLKQKLFRAWCPTSKQFIQKDFSIIGETTIFGMLEIHKHELKEKYNLDAVLELELTEFTGAHDNQGVKIYEGDIIEFDKKEWGGDDNIHLVEWDDKNLEWSWGGGCTSDMNFRTVIGNVFENPELLK